MEEVLDYSRSFIAFTTLDGANTARLQVDAACYICKEGETESYYLVASCRAEEVYRTQGLFKEANYDFSGIFGPERYVILRAYPTHEEGRPGLAERETGYNRDRFRQVELKLARVRAEALRTGREVVEAVLAGYPLVGRTALKPRGVDAIILEYPVKVINVSQERSLYQVDTGPLLYPDPKTQGGWLDRLKRAYIAYNNPAWVEFIVEEPLEISPVLKVPEYHRIVREEAESHLFTVK